MNSTIQNFPSTLDAEDLFIIPPGLFDEDKPFNLIDIPFCEKKQAKIYRFHQKWKKAYFNKMDYKESKEFISIKRQVQSNHRPPVLTLEPFTPF